MPSPALTHGQPGPGRARQGQAGEGVRGTSHLPPAFFPPQPSSPRPPWQGWVQGWVGSEPRAGEHFQTHQGHHAHWCQLTAACAQPAAAPPSLPWHLPRHSSLPPRTALGFLSLLTSFWDRCGPLKAWEGQQGGPQGLGTTQDPSEEPRGGRGHGAGRGQACPPRQVLPCPCSCPRVGRWPSQLPWPMAHSSTSAGGRSRERHGTSQPRPPQGLRPPRHRPPWPGGGGQAPPL